MQRLRLPENWLRQTLQEQGRSSAAFSVRFKIITSLAKVMKSQ
jgi:hypothetical protein